MFLFLGGFGGIERHNCTRIIVLLLLLVASRKEVLTLYTTTESTPPVVYLSLTKRERKKDLGSPVTTKGVVYYIHYSTWSSHRFCCFMGLPLCVFYCGTRFALLGHKVVGAGLFPRMALRRRVKNLCLQSKWFMVGLPLLQGGPCSG